MTATYLDTRLISVTELTPYARNPRRGDVEQIKLSLQRNGQYRALVVRQCPDSLIVLAGNHTLKAARELGQSVIRCEILTCDDQTARRISLADNRLNDLGTYLNEVLAAELTALDGDTSGTGYGEEDVSALIRSTDLFATSATAFLNPFLNPDPPPLPSPLTAPPPPPSASPFSHAPDTSPPANPYIPTGTPAQDPAAADQPAAPPVSPAPGLSSGDFVQVSWLVPVDDREVIRRALTAAQHHHGLSTAAAALTAISRHYLATTAEAA